MSERQTDGHLCTCGEVFNTKAGWERHWQIIHAKPVTRHYYVSTYCVHDLHADCRKTCKHCGAACLCQCHDRGAAPYPSENEKAAYEKGFKFGMKWAQHAIELAAKFIPKGDT